MSWTLSTEAGVELAKVLNFTPALERTKILTRLYGGAYLAQTVGQPSERPTANIVVESMAALESVNEAEASCALLRLSYAGKIYTGYIAAAPKWTPIIRGRVYSAAIQLAVEAVEDESA